MTKVPTLFRTIENEVAFKKNMSVKRTIDNISSDLKYKCEFSGEDFSVFGYWDIKNFKLLKYVFTDEDEEDFQDKIIEVKDNGVKKAEIGLNFLVPLCPKAHPLTVQVKILNDISDEIHYLLLIRIEADDGTFLSKETNVTFTNKAKYTFLDLGVTWYELFEEAYPRIDKFYEDKKPPIFSFYENDDHKPLTTTNEKGEIVTNYDDNKTLRIYFEFNQTKKKAKYGNITLDTLLNRPNPARKPRPCQDEPFERGFAPINQTNTAFDYISTFAEMLFTLTEFRDLIANNIIPDDTPFINEAGRNAINGMKSLFEKIKNNTYPVLTNVFTDEIKDKLSDIHPAKAMSKAADVFMKTIEPISFCNDEERIKLDEMFLIFLNVHRYCKDGSTTPLDVDTPQKERFMEFDFSKFDFANNEGGNVFEKFLRSYVDKDQPIIVNKRINGKFLNEQRTRSIKNSPNFLIFTFERAQRESSGDYSFVTSSIDGEDKFDLKWEFSTELFNMKNSEDYVLHSVISNENMQIEKPHLILYTLNDDDKYKKWYKVSDKIEDITDQVTAEADPDVVLGGNNAICVVYQRKDKKYPSDDRRKQKEIHVKYIHEGKITEEVRCDIKLDDFKKEMLAKYPPPEEEMSQVLWRVNSGRITANISEKTMYLSNVSDEVEVFVDYYLKHEEGTRPVFVSFFHNSKFQYLFTLFLNDKDPIGIVRNYINHYNSFDGNAIFTLLYRDASGRAREIKDEQTHTELINNGAMNLTIIVQFAEDSPSKNVYEDRFKRHLPERKYIEWVIPNELTRGEELNEIDNSEINDATWYISSQIHNFIGELFSSDEDTYGFYKIPAGIPAKELAKRIAPSLGIDDEDSDKIKIYKPDNDNEKPSDKPFAPDDIFYDYAVLSGPENSTIKLYINFEI